MENINLEYDKRSPKSIETYGKKLIGKTFREVVEEDDSSLNNKTSSDYGNSSVNEKKRNKGYLGDLLEEKYFHYQNNNDARPDFEEAGVELKVTPYKELKNGKISAKERLVINKINYQNDVGVDFEHSHFWQKAKLMLLVYYRYVKEISDSLDYKIGYVDLFTPPDKDLQVIKHDYETIITKIKAGKAHELSEADTDYLAATHKASTSKDSTTQPFSDIPAQPRAFSYKPSYMTYVLNNYIIPGKKTYESIIEVNDVKTDFEIFVKERLLSYQGESKKSLIDKFHIEFIGKEPKNIVSMLVYRMLGIKSNQAEEFAKANIVIKTIRIGKNGKIKENMSFPAFKYNELVKESWEDSTFGNYLRETRFLFVVFKYDNNDNLIFKGCQFWNIPYSDLEQVHIVWEKTKKCLQNGLEIRKINGHYEDNFPKQSENNVCHVRPHGVDSNDTDTLPDGREYPKHCFWLNNSYILSQLDKNLIN